MTNTQDKQQERLIVSKVSVGKTKQKRLTIPKQKETEDWEQDDLIKMEKLK